MEWQPIETAPKYGTKFIGLLESGFIATCYWGDTSYIYHPIFGKCNKKEWWKSPITSIEIVDPTHCMTLPGPPKMVEDI